MKFIKMKCPDCGSILDIDIERKQILFCHHCGSKLLIDEEIAKVQLDDPKKAGYEFEQGRIKAQKEEKRKEHEKQEKIAEAKRVMDENYKKHHAIAEQEMAARNAKYTLHGWLLFIAVIIALVLIPGYTFVKVIIGFFAGLFIYWVQSAKCHKDYEHSFNNRVDTDDEGNIIHAEKL